MAHLVLLSIKWHPYQVGLIGIKGDIIRGRRESEKRSFLTSRGVLIAIGIQVKNSLFLLYFIM